MGGNKRLEISEGNLIMLFHSVSVFSFSKGTNRYFQRIAMKMGLKVIFVDCTKLKCLEAAITPETKVGERELTCLMSLNNFIDATAGWGVCGKVLCWKGSGVVSVGRGQGTAAMGPPQCKAEPGTEVRGASESKGPGGREEGKKSRKQQREHQDLRRRTE